MKTKIEKYTEFVAERFCKNEILSFIAAGFIALFELVYTIIISFSWNEYDNTVIYFSSYVALFTVTVVEMTILLLTRKKPYYKNVVYYVVHIYNVLIAIWALVISSLDVLHGSYPIVFILIMFALPFFIIITPYINIIIDLVGMVDLIWLTYVYKPDTGLGHTMNLIVVCVMLILVSFLSYRSNLRSFELEHQLRESSTHDGLTKLLNRGSLDEKLEEVAGANVRTSVVLLDCDDFKRINDTYGHRFGDRCLVRIAELLKQYFGEKCYRYGGDEYVVITDYTNDKIKYNFEVINDTLAEEFKDRNIMVSAGVCNIESVSTSKDIIVKADKALYHAKLDRHGLTVIYGDNLN